MKLIFYELESYNKLMKNKKNFHLPGDIFSRFRIAAAEPKSKRESL